MKIGFAYDTKEKIVFRAGSSDDALEEYDSMETVNLLASLLGAKGDEVILLGGGREFLRNIQKKKVDIVFNISEGRGETCSREAEVPAVLEMMGIPYTHSDPQCLAICLDKDLTNKIVTLNGVNVPPSVVVNNLDDLAEINWAKYLPAIIKPVFEGSSKGVDYNSLVSNVKRAKEVLAEKLKIYRKPMMIERFIAGHEVTVGIIGNDNPGIVGIMNIEPRSKNSAFVYSLEVKRNWQQMVDYRCPAKLSPRIIDKLTAVSLKTFKTLKCHDVARIDFRISPEGEDYFLEINPLPGLGTHSDLVIMALKMGWTHESLVHSILETAMSRHRFPVNV